MDFNEKLQHLRKQQNMTQEQLAEKLYVSRTAISKWESGKGYPNIESLKSIAELFNITIDDLLSGDELIVVAQTENNTNLKKIYATIFGILDLAAILFVLLPLYWDSKLEYSVNLFSFSDATATILIFYWLFIVLLILLGCLELLFIRLKMEQKTDLLEKISLIWSVMATLFFGVAKEPYVVAFMFLLFLVKSFLWIKRIKIK